MVADEQLWKVALAGDVEQTVQVLTAHLHGSLQTVQTILEVVETDPSSLSLRSIQCLSRRASASVALRTRMQTHFRRTFLWLLAGR